MKPGQKIDLGMTGYAELFMSDEERKTQTLPRIVDIPIELVDDFPDHPFKVRMDEDMQQLVESIRERGMITPVILRKKEDDRYEIVSGHRRKKACEIAGLQTIKAEVREMTRDEAIIMMVESNLQRSVILPSEKAFSYKMRLEAMKRQGMRTDLTSVPSAQKSKTSREMLGEAVGESQDYVRRFIRLTELVPAILDLVDEGKIGLRPAVELSYLTKHEQEMLVEAMAFAEAQADSGNRDIHLFCTPELYRLLTEVPVRDGTARKSLTRMYDLVSHAGIFDYTITTSEATGLISIRVSRLFPDRARKPVRLPEARQSIRAACCVPAG